MKSIAKYLATALFCAIVVGGSALAQTVNIDYDHTVNFMKFKTYTWAHVHATDPAVENRITIAFNRDMASRYMTETQTGGDVTISAVEVTSDKQEYTDFYNGISNLTWQRGWGSGGFMEGQASLQDLQIGSLVIDMYDTKTQKIIWRGVVAEPVANGVLNVLKVDKAVTQLITKYPPKFSK
jgi:hypothetical protein